VFVISERVWLGFDGPAQLQAKIDSAIVSMKMSYRQLDDNTEFVISGDLDGEDNPCLKISAYNVMTEEVKLRNEYLRLDRHHTSCTIGVESEKALLGKAEIRLTNAKIELDDFLALHPEFKI
jgi:hypothetical protein